VLNVYTTFPVILGRHSGDFRERFALEAKWAEAAGIRGMLIYTDNTLLDPWAAAAFLIERTERLVPLVAVNPMYIHPFSVARTISSLGFLHERGVHLNFVTGGFQRHLDQIGCRLDHDQRYDQLAECAEVVIGLLQSTRPVTYPGEYFQLSRATVTPRLDPALLPEVFVAGTSLRCQDVQRRLGADAALAGTGLRMGIIARDTAEEAWRIALDRFPVYPEGEELHELAAETVSSEWHLTLSSDAMRSSERAGVYWLYPFRSYRTFCPYLVGSYGDVGALVARYLELGATTIILDELYEEDDIHHTMLALERAVTRTGTRSAPGS
jgi:alkanesulfonate monooxygenase